MEKNAKNLASTMNAMEPVYQLQICAMDHAPMDLESAKENVF